MKSERLWDYMTESLSAGRVILSLDEAQRNLGSSRGALLDAAERQQRQGQLLKLRPGFYVIVPPQFLAWGAPPPSWYIDDLMRYEGHPYYVGLLKAAELHGATHQAVTEFQIVTDKRLPKIRAGRSLIVFYYRKAMLPISEFIQQRKTDTGNMRVSSLELTLFDLVRYPRASGGIDNLATVLSDLADKIDADRLGKLSAAFERSIGQRLGYLLDWLGHSHRTLQLRETLFTGKALAWVELESRRGDELDLQGQPIRHDKRWQVIIRRDPERDE